jgi:hypothetical protein
MNHTRSRSKRICLAARRRCGGCYGVLVQRRLGSVPEPLTRLRANGIADLPPLGLRACRHLAF